MVVGEVSSSVDLLVIGGGPGGYAAALNASRLGRTVSLVENATTPPPVFGYGKYEIILFVESTDTTTPTAVVADSVAAFLIKVSTVGALKLDELKVIVLYALIVAVEDNVFPP